MKGLKMSIFCKYYFLTKKNIKKVNPFWKSVSISFFSDGGTSLSEEVIIVMLAKIHDCTYL